MVRDSSSDLGLVDRAFSVMGRRPSDFTNPDFSIRHMVGWETPSFSPIVLRPGCRLTVRSLEDIERFFEIHPIENPGIIEKVPYFNVYNRPDLYDLVGVKEVAEAHDWQADDQPLIINTIRRPIPFRVPAGYFATFSPYGEPTTLADFHTTVRESFGAGDTYLRLMDKAHEAAPAHTYTVLIHHAGRSLAAGASCFIGPELAFLTWGNVLAEHQGQGLVKALQSVIMMIAHTHGAHYGVLASRQAPIMKKNDGWVELWIYRKIVL